MKVFYKRSRYLCLRIVSCVTCVWVSICFFFSITFHGCLFINISNDWYVCFIWKFSLILIFRILNFFIETFYYFEVYKIFFNKFLSIQKALNYSLKRVGKNAVKRERLNIFSRSCFISTFFVNKTNKANNFFKRTINLRHRL